MPAVAVLVDTDPVECRRQNRARDRPVPAPALEGQLRRMQAAAVEIRGEGWDLVTTARQAQPEASHTPGARMRPASSGSGRSGWAWCCSCRDFPGVRTRQARHAGWPRWPTPPPRLACRESR